MDSPSSRFPDDRDEHWPICDNSVQLDGHEDNHRGGRGFTPPMSPVSSISSVAELSQDDIRVEDIISIGPVRTVQVRKNGVPHGKPKVVLVSNRNSTRSDKVIADGALPSTLPTKPSVAAPETGRAWHTRLGRWTLFVLVGGTVLLLATFGFLVWLWLATTTNPIWRSIVSDSWTARLITLSSAVIGIVVFFQAAVATTIIASIHLDKFDTQWLNPAMRSVSRAGGTQPYALLIRRLFSKQSSPLVVVTILLTLTTIALQFTSTILLSDLSIGSFEARKNMSTNMAYGLSTDQRTWVETTKTDFTKTTPLQFPAFAEYLEEPEDQNGIDDTGLTVRALLPIAASAKRESISTYSGQATVINSRSICLAPAAVNMTFSSSGPSFSPSSSTQRVEGTVNMGGKLPAGLNTTSPANDTNMSAPQDRDILFSCSFQLSQSNLEWPISMCTVAAQQNLGLVISSPFANGHMSDTSVFILMNHTMNSTIPISAIVASNDPDASGAAVQPVTIGNWTSKSSEPWNKLTYAQNPIFSIQLSLCFTSFGGFDSDIEAHGSSSRTEPFPTMDVDGDVFSLNVSSVLTQLGAMNTTLSENDRGMLALEKRAAWGDPNGGTVSLDRVFDSSNSNTTYGLCTYCGTYDSHSENSNALGIDYTLSIIFQRVLQSTGSPAKALQSLFTVTNTMQYYSRLPLFNIAAPVRSTEYQPAMYPNQHKGLIAVGVLLGTHLSLLAILTAVLL